METIAPETKQAGKPEIAEKLGALFEKQRANRWRVAQTTAAQRIAKLERLGEGIWARREELHRAVWEDYRKNPSETDLTEVFPVISEIKHTASNLARWMEPVPVETPLTLLGTRAEIRYEPRGMVLILAPWNYPFNLAMAPLVAAVSAGNCVILRPSSKTPATARFLESLIGEVFDDGEVAVVQGGHDLSEALLELPFDHIFFTGSAKIGQRVMAAASRHLATVTLELGGKSPVIVDETADIRKAAERIVWGKFLNAGQTCVAPDYLLIHESRLEDFVEQSKRVVARRYGEGEEARRQSPDFCRIVNAEYCRTLAALVEESVRRGARVAFGGASAQDERYFAPTMLLGVREDSPIMQEEIFGPVLPVLTWRSLDEAIRIVQSRPKPLALYIFSRDRKNVQRVLSSTTAGGTCVNSLIIHLANPNLPFGGVGASGMGSYHGHFGFRALSHERAVLTQGFWDSLRFYYPPYTPRVRRLIELAMKYLA